jgi:hypothetical protein
MIGSPYKSCMHPASRILFAMAVVIGITSFDGEVLGLTLPGTYDNATQVNDKTGKLLTAVANALYSAVLPLFGAAFIQRIDTMLEARP